MTNTSAITSSAANLNAFYATLPTVASGTLHINDGMSAGSNTAIATAKGWAVSL